MQEETKEIEFVACPHCKQKTMPKGNKYCSHKCWESSMIAQYI